MDSLVTGEDRIDVEAIMGEIRERVREKKAQGYYSDEELGRLAELELSPGPPMHRDEVGPSLPDDWYRHHFDQLDVLWDPRVEIAITSHRPRLGKYIVWGKSLVRRIMRPYTNVILSRQSEFNVNVVGLLRNLVRLQGELWERLNVWNQELRDSQHTFLRMVAEAKEGEVSLRETAEELRQESLLHKRRLENILSTLERMPAGQGPLGERLRDEQAHLTDHTYFRFEQRFRGTSERIRAVQEVYIPVFAGGEDVLDVGCGRGEFLELLRENGISAQGVDTNEDMVEVCRSKGLRVTLGDASEYISGLEDDSLGGVFAAQVVEHLEAVAIIRLVKLCHQKLRKGAPIVVETVNPTSVLAATSNFHLDLAHVKPIHPEAMRFLLEAEGFQKAEITYLAPVEDDAKLRTLPVDAAAEPWQRELVSLLNENTERLNALLYGYQDYAVVARK